MPTLLHTATSGTPLIRVRDMLWLLVLSASLISLSAELAPEWVKTAGSGMAVYRSTLSVNGQGHIHMIGTVDQKLLVVQYGPNGMERWRKILPEGVAQASVSLASDGDSHLWITATSSSTATNVSTRIWQLDDIGQLNWTRVLDVNPSALTSLTVDSAGNGYFAGVARKSDLAQQSDSFLVVKYAPDGMERWRQVYIPVSFGSVRPTGTATDAAGNLLVVGAVTITPGPTTSLTLKFDPSGVLQWDRQDEVPSPPGAFAVDTDGSVCITATIKSAFRTMKISASGERLWVVEHPSAFSAGTAAQQVHLDSLHNVIVNGLEIRRLNEDDNEYDSVIIKYDGAGTELWSARSPNKSPAVMAVDHDGKIYVTGQEQQPLPSGIFLLEYDQAGHQLWEQSIARSAPGDLVLDGQGQVYLASTAWGPAGPDPSLQLRCYTKRDDPNQLTAVISPPSATVVASSNVTFSASITGPGPFQYQWRRGGFNVLGATNATLVLTNVQPGNAGGPYTLLVKNSTSFTVSPESWLIVGVPAGILSGPQSVQIVSGRPGALSIRAFGDPPLSYQWSLNGKPVPGATNSVLPWTAVKEVEAGLYTVSVSNVLGGVISTPAVVKVMPRIFADDWRWRHPLPQGNDLTCATYGLGHYLAGGKNGTLISSIDGTQWTSQFREALGDLQALRFANGLFIAFSARRGIFSSENGLDWTQRYENDFSEFTGVAYGNGVWLAAQRGMFLRSTNGIDWLDDSIPGRINVQGLAFGQGRFVGVNGDQSYLSTNGLTWTTHPIDLPPAFFHRIIFGRDRFVAYPDPRSTSAGVCAVSTDGVHWNGARLTPGLTLLDMAAGPGTFVALGNSTDRPGTSICVSEDGLSWAPLAVSIPNQPIHVTYLKDQFFILGDDGLTLNSPDGLHWSIIGGATDTNLRGVAYGNGRFVAVGNNGRVLTAGQDAVWTKPAAIGNINLRGVAFGAGRFVAVGGVGQLFTSEDGRAWTENTSGTNALNAVCYGNGVFLAAGSHGSLFRSSDGLHWSSISLGATQDLQSATFAGGRFVIGGSNGANLWAKEISSWTARTDLVGTVTGVAFGNEHFVAVTDLGQIAVCREGTPWVLARTNGVPIQSVVYGGGSFVAAGAGGAVWHSSDGFEWSEHYSGCVNTLRQVVYAEGKFVAVGNNETVLQSAQAAPLLRLFVASEGLRMEAQPVLGASHFLQGSNDLSVWTDLLQFVGLQDLISITNSLASVLPHSFYRVRTVAPMP